MMAGWKIFLAACALLVVGCAERDETSESDSWLLQSPALAIEKILRAKEAGEFEELRVQWSQAQGSFEKATNRGEYRNAHGIATYLAVALLDDAHSERSALNFLLLQQKNEDPTIRANLALGLAEARTIETLDILRELEIDQDTRVSEAAKQSLEWRSGRE